MFTTRSLEPERIDTGDYTSEEYERFLKEIRFFNRYTGDIWAAGNALRDVLKGISGKTLSVLDVGAGSGELLRSIVDSPHVAGYELNLVGIDFNQQSADSIIRESADYSEIKAVQGDAMHLPFEDSSFDLAICSLFTHHLTDDQIVNTLTEMNRISSYGVIVIDLHRHPIAYVAYKAICKAIRISELVTHDGSLSILKSFKPVELLDLGKKAGLKDVRVIRSFPFRLVLRSGSGLKPNGD